MCQEPGLFLSQAYTYLGDSPDGVIRCNCCGEGILEIKCPWTSREKLNSEYITQNQFKKVPPLYALKSTLNVCYR